MKQSDQNRVMSLLNRFLSRTLSRVPNRISSRVSFEWVVSLMCIHLFCLGCVVEEDLSSTYNQAHIGLNQWDFQTNSQGSRITFNLGYLIGMNDPEGIESINWSYRLVDPDQREYAQFSEEMRKAEPERKQVFVQGKRDRVLEVPHTLTTGDRYILWFVLSYRGEILKEKLFSIEAGSSGGDPSWVNGLPGANNIDVSEFLEGNQNQAESSSETPSIIDSTDEESPSPILPNSNDSE